MDIEISDIEAIPGEILALPEVIEISRYLLDKFLITHIEGITTVARIVETEAYKAPEDRGSHAYGNRRTARTEVMFGDSGKSYVYLCYGLHNMLNVVTGPNGLAHAVLIRAVEPVSGVEVMTKRRKGRSGYALTNGPGKVCEAMGITREHNGVDLTVKYNSIWLGMNTPVPESSIVEGPRVGIAYAKEWAHKPWRFRVKDNNWTSKPDQVVYR